MKKVYIIISFFSLFFMLTACSRTYSVRFVDHNDRLLESFTVSRGESLEAIEAPVRFGYIFDSWDQDLENINKNLIVKPIYLENAELSALNQLLERVIKADNLTVKTYVYIDNDLTNTYEYHRNGNLISSKYYHDEDRLDLFVTMEDGVRYGYQYMEEDSCWARVQIDELQFNVITSEHSRTNMLPYRVELDWFDHNGTSYVLRNDFFNDLAYNTMMSGSFRRYHITPTSNGLNIFIEVVQGFNRLSYFIEFSSLNTTSLEKPNFNICPPMFE